MTRMNVFQIEQPTADASRSMARRIYQCILAEHDWGKSFEAEPPEDVLDHFVGRPPREMRHGWMTGLGNACLRNANAVEMNDLPGAEQGKRRMGF